MIDIVGLSLMSQQFISINSALGRIKDKSAERRVLAARQQSDSA